MKYHTERFSQGFGEVAKEYLVNAIKPKCDGSSFDGLRYQQYTSKRKAVINLIPASCLLQGHLEFVFTLFAYPQI